MTGPVINSDGEFQPLPSPKPSPRWIGWKKPSRIPFDERLQSLTIKKLRKAHSRRILLFTALAGVGIAALIGFLIWLRFARGPWEVLFR